MSLKDKKREKEIINRRLTIISPVLNAIFEGKDREKAIDDTAQKNNISRRTVLRYLILYQKCLETGDMSGMAPKGRKDVVPKISKEIVDRAIELRIESPSRSLSLIIAIIESENLADNGEIKRTTLQNAMARRGYTAKSVRANKEEGSGSTRFQKTYRNELWMGDIKFGPSLKIKGKSVNTYLSVLIDDYSRHIVFARFYDSLGAEIIVDSLRQAFEKYGIPVALYFDNGKQYCSEQVKNCCEVLDVKLLHCKPRCASSKGKVEKFIQYAGQDMIDEFSKNPTNSLDDLNLRLNAWLENRYEHKVHSETKETPYDRYFGDENTRLHFVDPAFLNFAFLNISTRIANKCGEISFGNRSFFAGKDAACRQVYVMYKTKTDDKIYVKYEEKDWYEVRPTVVGPFVVKSRKIDKEEKPEKSSDILTNLIRIDNPDYVPPREETSTPSEDVSTPKKQRIKYNGFTDKDKDK